MARLRVLIADDTASIRGLLRTLLEEKQFEIIGEAVNGRAAIELVEELAPDVVIMDYQMPILGGIDATKEIKARHPAVAVFGFTSVLIEDAEQKMLEAGATASFDKLHTKELMDALETLTSH